MRTLAFSVFINRPPAEVFDYMTDLANDRLWQKQLVASEWVTPEPAGVGSIKRVTSRIFGRETEGMVEYIAWDRPGGYSFTAAAGPFSVAGTTTLEAQESGTLVTVKGQVEAAGIARLLEGLVIRQVEKQDLENFNRLKVLLEKD
jgi:uncharacterized protein YndB with AHSA1/START domain